MIEIDDYNGDYFFDKEEEGDQLQSILEDYEEVPNQEKDVGYNIFTLEQAISTINSLRQTCSEIGIAAQEAVRNINNFIDLYTRYVNNEL